MYTREEAHKASLEYFNGDDLAAKVFVDKYSLKNREGELLELTPKDMHLRLAKEFYRIENSYINPMSEEEIFDLMDKFKYVIPQGSPMSAIGNPYHVQSSGNCFSIKPPYDSYGGIFYTDQQLAQLMKRRCGVGVSLNTLRPKGLPVRNAAKTTDGISVFMERYSNTCREVAQNSRRGAEILLLSVHHPEIKTFINIKRDKKKVTGANISIQVTDEFMNAVKNNEEFELRWPIEGEPAIKQKIQASEIWDNFILANWESAEPGLLFWDTVIKNSVSNCYGKIDDAFYDTACNPCGEIVMGMDSCRLLAINLYSFVNNKFTDKAEFDFVLFRSVVRKAQRLMDDMIDLEIELIQKILNKIDSDPEPDNIKTIERETWSTLLETCKKGRRTGLGVTGLGDTLASLNIRYGSLESIEVTEEIYKELCVNAYYETCVLAKERGTFPIFSYDIEKDDLFLEKVFKSSPEVHDLYRLYGRRNIALTTTPPAGTISIEAQVTSGIEPVFRVKYSRRKKVNPGDADARVDFVDKMGDSWQEFEVVHRGFMDWMDATGKSKIEDSPYYLATASDVDWISSVDIQSVAQKWICHAISKTCNLPKDATKELISQVFMRAWESGCKGFTVYRDGCRDGVLVNKEDTKTETIVKTSAPKRVNRLPGDIHHLTVKGEKYYVVVGMLEKDPYEVFTGINADENKDPIIPKRVKYGHIIKKGRSNYLLESEEGESFKLTGDHSDDLADALTRMISTSLRHGVDISFIVHQLEKTKGDMMCYSKALARTLKKYIADGTKVSGESCTSCGNPLIRQDGCVKCMSCGWSKC